MNKIRQSKLTSFSLAIGMLVFGVAHSSDVSANDYKVPIADIQYLNLSLY